MLKCALCLCLYVRSGEAQEAVTVIEGTAVCEDHLGIVAQGLDWHAVLKAAMKQEREHRDQYGDIDLGVPEDPGAWRG